jgi:NAD(P)-dependent dehydrogenase (short-subunit alcohol dehydrogenase family)
MSTSVPAVTAGSAWAWRCAGRRSPAPSATPTTSRSPEIGTLTPGKQADIVIIDSRSPHLDGFGDPVAVMVLGAGPADVETVIVGGEVVKREGKLTGGHATLARELMHATRRHLRAQAPREKGTIMARVLITGSADGLGLMAAAILAGQGHAVTLHARNDRRAGDADRELPSAQAVITGDLSTIAGMRKVAEAANATGRYDAVIHNAGIGYREPRRVETEDGLEHVFAVNVLAPYLLTALINPPARLVYLSSGMHRGGNASLADPQWTRRRWNGAQAYSDSKLFDVVLAFAAARHWPAVLSNALEPGWVPTRMGGPGAPDDLSLAPVTQAWLAVSDDPAATVTAGYFYHQQPRQVHPAARDTAFQDQLLDYCASLTGIALPADAVPSG